MAETVSEIASAISAGTSGPNTPDNMVVKRPALEALRGLLLFGAAASALVAFVIVDLTWFGWTVASEHQRIQAIGGLGFCMAFCAVLTIAAFAMPTIGRVEASAGPGHIELGGDK